MAVSVPFHFVRSYTGEKNRTSFSRNEKKKKQDLFLKEKRSRTIIIFQPNTLPFRPQHAHSLPPTPIPLPHPRNNQMVALK